jgi:SAM-dependent methyltransferase
VFGTREEAAMDRIEGGNAMKNNLWYLHLVKQDRLEDQHDVSSYSSDPTFINAGRVVDLGTGNGNHLAILAQAFPDKVFTGIDNDREAIEIASTRHRLGNLHFVEGDVEDERLHVMVGSNDYVIARLLVQHLTSVSRFATQVSSILNSKGELLVVDVHESSKRFLPDMPTYRSIFCRFREHQRHKRGNEEVFTLPLVLKQNGFIIQDEIIVVKNTDSHYKKDVLYDVLVTNLSVLEKTYGIAGNYVTARQELDRWRSADSSYASLGDYIIKARKG